MTWLWQGCISSVAYNVLTTCPQGSPMLAMHKNSSLNIARSPNIEAKIVIMQNDQKTSQNSQNLVF